MAGQQIRYHRRNPITGWRTVSRRSSSLRFAPYGFAVRAGRRVSIARLILLAIVLLPLAQLSIFVWFPLVLAAEHKLSKRSKNAELSNFILNQDFDLDLSSTLIIKDERKNPGLIIDQIVLDHKAKHILRIASDGNGGFKVVAQVDTVFSSDGLLDQDLDLVPELDEVTTPEPAAQDSENAIVGSLGALAKAWNGLAKEAKRYPTTDKMSITSLLSDAQQARKHFADLLPIDTADQATHKPRPDMKGLYRELLLADLSIKGPLTDGSREEAFILVAKLLNTDPREAERITSEALVNLCKTFSQKRPNVASDSIKVIAVNRPRTL